MFGFLLALRELRNHRANRGAFLLSASLVFAPLYAETSDVTDSGCTQGEGNCEALNVVEEQASRSSVLDTSHRYVTRNLDDVARWFDGFFGDRELERESAHSIVRLQYNYSFIEAGESDDKLRLRGKVRLPKINRRLHLVFSDEEDENLTSSNDRNLFNNEESEAVALQLDVREEREFKLDHRVGLRSGDQVRVGSRARYQRVFADRWKGRISEELFWQDTVGFGTRTILDLDYVHDPVRLTRWRNRFDFDEESNGVEWSSLLSFNRALGDERALSYYLRAFGYTQPRYLTSGYGPGLVFRQNFLKNWLFYEVEPQYGWYRDEINSRREGIASVTLRLEVVFGEKYLH